MSEVQNEMEEGSEYGYKRQYKRSLILFYLDCSGGSLSVLSKVLSTAYLKRVVYWLKYTSTSLKQLVPLTQGLLDCKEMQPVHSEGGQPWDFFGGNAAKAETPVLWPPHAKSWLIAKDSDAGRDWGQEEKGTTEDEMAGWCHWPDGRESQWTPGVSDGQGGLACCDS